MAAAANSPATAMRCVFDGCIAAADTEVRRRPYHRNCGCALHRSGGGCGAACSSRLSYATAVEKRSQYCKEASVVATLSAPFGDLVEIKGDRISKHKGEVFLEIGSM